MRDGARGSVEPELLAVDERLLQWGRWARNDGVPGDYPRSTMLARVMEQGPMGAAQQGRSPTTIPELIALVDAAVAKLVYRQRCVVFVRYVYFAGMPAEIQRAKLGLSEYRWKVALRDSRWRVWTLLEATFADRRNLAYNAHSGIGIPAGNPTLHNAP
jgi:hypothetical protein